MRYVFLRLWLLGELYVEFGSVTRGHRWFDYLIEGNEILLWIGSIHAIYAPHKKVRQEERAHDHQHVEPGVAE